MEYICFNLQIHPINLDGTFVYCNAIGISQQGRILVTTHSRHVPKGGGQGGHMPPQILADQKALPAAVACRITVRPPRFLDFGTCLKHEERYKHREGKK